MDASARPPRQVSPGPPRGQRRLQSRVGPATVPGSPWGKRGRCFQARRRASDASRLAVGQEGRCLQPRRRASDASSPAWGQRGDASIIARPDRSPDRSYGGFWTATTADGSMEGSTAGLTSSDSSSSESPTCLEARGPLWHRSLSLWHPPAATAASSRAHGSTDEKCAGRRCPSRPRPPSFARPRRLRGCRSTRHRNVVRIVRSSSGPAVGCGTVHGREGGWLQRHHRP